MNKNVNRFFQSNIKHLNSFLSKNLDNQIEKLAFFSAQTDSKFSIPFSVWLIQLVKSEFLAHGLLLQGGKKYIMSI